MKHDPKTCHLCAPAAARLRHPAYRRLLPLLVLPTPRRGGAA
ncbi:hypothetical protein EES45_23165 [Streptomyces sp. ADI97-07]|nr:hypothetical protein EES45_23165 [Streptomyces sp. ADI97-07]